MLDPKSWIAIVYAASGSLLLGGQKKHESSRFEKQHHAEAFASAVTRTNQSIGRKVDRSSVVPSKLEPEIFGEQVETVH